METLLTVHSIVRWLIVIVGILAAIKFATGWIRRDRFAGMDRGLSAGFSGLIDLQAALGFIFLLGRGLTGDGFPRHRLEHAVTMIIVLVIAHLTARWKSSPDTLRFRNSFFVMVVTLGLIVVGVALLPKGWSG